MRLVLVYGYEPSGHASAALALEAAAEALGHEAVRVNISADYHPILGPALAKTYLKVIQKAPGLWAALYDNKAVADLAQDWRKLYRFLERGKLRAKLSELEPDLIVCTHAPPLAALGLEKARGGLSCPLIAAITDYEVHSYWIGAGADLYLVPTSGTAELLARRGIPPARIRDTGIPIHPAFAEPLDSSQARKNLGLPQDGPVLLLSGGSRGIGPIPEIAGALLKGLPEAAILVACGDNQALCRKLSVRSDGRLKVYGAPGPERMRELLAASDLLIGKAGGLTVAESLALGVPMLIVEPIPGQEERNADFLVRHGAALRVEAAEAENLARRLLAEPERLEGLRRKALALGRPESARKGLEAILRGVPAL